MYSVRYKHSKVICLEMIFFKACTTGVRAEAALSQSVLFALPSEQAKLGSQGISPRQGAFSIVSRMARLSFCMAWFVSLKLVFFDDFVSGVFVSGVLVLGVVVSGFSASGLLTSGLLFFVLMRVDLVSCGFCGEVSTKPRRGIDFALRA